jgi:hypothetical protein
MWWSPPSTDWTWRDHHLNLAPGIAAPTGSYDADRLLTTGYEFHIDWLVAQHYSSASQIQGDPYRG